MMADDIQRFAETLEMNDLPLPQEPQRRQHIRVVCQVDEVFVGGAGLLLCCTFENVM